MQVFVNKSAKLLLKKMYYYNRNVQWTSLHPGIQIDQCLK